MSYREVSEIRDGMRIDWDMPITMDDGIVLRCRHLPADRGGQVSGDHDATARTASGCTSRTSTPSSGGCMCAEPSRRADRARPTSTSAGRWSIRRNGCRTATSCIRVDSRGAGRSPGVIDIWSLREAQDLAICVEWAGVQPWSNGKVGLNGISYYGENQWQMRGARSRSTSPPCAPGRAPPTSTATWRTTAASSATASRTTGRARRSIRVQHGRGTRGFKSRMTGDWVSGPDRR